MKRIVLIGTLISINAFGQNVSEIDFKFSVANQAMNMDQVNSIILDASKVQNGNINLPRVDSFNSGTKLTGSLGYQLTPLWGIGLQSSFQSSKCSHDDGLSVFIGGMPDTVHNKTTYSIVNYSIGAFCRFNISNALNFGDHNNFLNRISAGLTLHLAHSSTRFFETEFYFDPEKNDILVNEVGRYQGEANGLHSELSFDVGIDLTRKKIITGVGLEFGYQYLVSTNLSNRGGENFLGTNDSANVNLSGVFFGTYFKLGK